MTTNAKGTIKRIYGFHLTHEADEMTDALYTLYAHGKPTRVYVQVLGGNKYNISVDYLDQEHAIIMHIGIADSAATAMQMAIAEYENPTEVKNSEGNAP